MNYDLQLSDARRRVTSVLCSNGGKPDLCELAGAIDDLNKAWDELTDCLVRHRQERDSLIRKLIDELAEVRRGR